MNDTYESLCLIDEERRNLNNQITPLNGRLRELEGRRRELIINRLAVNVGRCFVADTFSHPGKNGFVKILDVPRPRPIGIHSDFNPYQYPVLYIPGVVHDGETGESTYPLDGFIPFEEDMLYSMSCTARDPYEALSGEYQEISHEDFEARFNRVVEQMRQDMKFEHTDGLIHGRWIAIGNGGDHFACSICGAMAKTTRSTCPCCGALMDITERHLGGTRDE